MPLSPVPSIIREIFSAPPSSEAVSSLLHAALQRQNSDHYELAAQMYLQAQSKWLQEFQSQGQSQLPADVKVFLRLAIASVLTSAGRDEGALAENIEATQIASEYLPPDHLTSAAAQSALGATYIHLGQHDLAADHLLRALETREQILGPGHPDTALVLNNLGCCLQGLGRLEAADIMYRRAEVALASQYALSHPRRAIVRDNIRRLGLGLQGAQPPPPSRASP